MPTPTRRSAWSACARKLTQPLRRHPLAPRCARHAAGTKLHKKLGATLFESTDAGDTAQAETDFFEGELTKKAAAADTLTGTITPIKSASGQSELTASLSSKSSEDKPAAKPGKKLLVKKKGLGAKSKKKTGGLGAKKKATGASFDEIENKLKKGDDDRAKMTALEQESALAEAAASAKQAKMNKFAPTASKTSKRDLSQMDEHKRAQAERLGMGMGRTNTNANIFAHSTSKTPCVSAFSVARFFFAGAHRA